MSTSVETTSQNFAEKLKAETAAVKFTSWKFGARKALSPDQKTKAAEAFGAEGEILSASKKLLNTKHGKYKAVSTALNRPLGYWKLMTVWYPVKGIRLIRRDLIPQFEEQMATYREELDQAVAVLQENYAELRAAAEADLAELFNSCDYPDTIGDYFGFKWEYPSVEPPNYLKELNPALYEAEKNRIAERFSNAVSHAEEAFTAELGNLVGHLVEKLSGKDEDGKPKTFNKSAVGNLNEFFSRFKTLSVGSNAELEALVSQAEAAISGVDVSDLRKDKSLREHVAGDLAKVQDVLDGLIVDKPSRAFRLDDDEEAVEV